MKTFFFYRGQYSKGGGRRWSAGEKCKEFQVAQVVREERRCERDALHGKKKVAAAARPFSASSVEGGIRMRGGCEGEARTLER